MDLDQVSGLHLRYFLAVVDHGSVAGAARALGVAQPSLSQQIRLLEQRVGARLFDRTSTGMVPTAAGQELAVAAQTWLSAAGSLRCQRHPMRVGIPRGIDAVAMVALHERLGDDLVLVECASSAAASRVRGRRLDAAVIREPLEDDRSGLETIQLLSRPLGVLGSSEDIASLPVTSDGTTLIASLVGKSLIWFDEDRAPGFAQALLGDLHAAGWVPELVRIDPATTTMTEDALLRRPDLVMLRPQPQILAPGLSWVRLAPTIVERLSILQQR